VQLKDDLILARSEGLHFSAVELGACHWVDWQLDLLRHHFTLMCIRSRKLSSHRRCLKPLINLTFYFAVNFLDVGKVELDSSAVVREVADGVGSLAVISHFLEW